MFSNKKYLADFLLNIVVFVVAIDIIVILILDKASN